MLKTTCKFCKKGFETIYPNKKWCNDICREKTRLLNLRGKTIIKKKQGVIKLPLYRHVKFSPNEDKALKALRNSGFNSSVIAEVFGRTKPSVHFRANQIGANFKNPMSDNKEKNQASKAILEKFKTRTKPLEFLSNNIIYNKLIVSDFALYSPAIMNQEYDLIIYKNKKFFKVQLKTAGYNKVNNMYFMTRTNLYKSVKGKLTNNYKYPNIDFILVNCIGTQHCYVLPNKLIKKHNIKSLNFYPSRIRYFRRNRTTFDTDTYLERFDLIK